MVKQKKEKKKKEFKKKEGGGLCHPLRKRAADVWDERRAVQSEGWSVIECLFQMCRRPERYTVEPRREASEDGAWGGGGGAALKLT